MKATVNYQLPENLGEILTFGRYTTSKHLYARKLRAAARLKKRRGIVLDMPKKPKK